MLGKIMNEKLNPGYTNLKENNNPIHRNKYNRNKSCN